MDALDDDKGIVGVSRPDFWCVDFQRQIIQFSQNQFQYHSGNRGPFFGSLRLVLDSVIK